MAFTDAVKTDMGNIGAGEVLYSKPNSIDFGSTFEDGLEVGRFCKYDTGSYDNLDTSAAPYIAGVVKRKTTGEIGVTAYTADNDKAEICNFGYVAVDVVPADTPTKYGTVYAENQTAGEFGKATTVAAGNVEVTAADFWEDLGDNVWLVRLKQFV